MSKEMEYLGGSGWQSAMEERFGPVPTEPEKKHFSNKPLSKLTAQEIRERWQTEKPEEFEQTDPAYTMPIDELRMKADEQLKAQAAEALGARQSQNATTFVSMTPEYKFCPANAEVMAAELKRRNLPGTVLDLVEIFNDLKTAGKLELNPVPMTPTRIYSEAELRAMPVEDARLAIEEMHRKGIF